MRELKRLLLALPIVVLMLAGCPKNVPVTPPAPAPSPYADHSITLKWQQSFANNGACSSTVTKSCISGFNEGYLIGTTLAQLNVDSAAVCTGTTQPEPCASTFNAVLPIGSILFYVDTTYVDQNGAAGVTSYASSPGTQVNADAPVSGSVTATINN